MAGGINDPDDLVKATIPLFYICSDVWGQDGGWNQRSRRSRRCCI
jgi:hypothetical protein